MSYITVLILKSTKFKLARKAEDNSKISNIKMKCRMKEPMKRGPNRGWCPL